MGDGSETSQELSIKFSYFSFQTGDNTTFISGDVKSNIEANITNKDFLFSDDNLGQQTNLSINPTTNATETSYKLYNNEHDYEIQITEYISGNSNVYTIRIPRTINQQDANVTCKVEKNFNLNDTLNAVVAIESITLPSINALQHYIIHGTSNTSEETKYYYPVFLKAFQGSSELNLQMYNNTTYTVYVSLTEGTEMTLTSSPDSNSLIGNISVDEINGGFGYLTFIEKASEAMKTVLGKYNGQLGIYGNLYLNPLKNAVNNTFTLTDGDNLEYTFYSDETSIVNSGVFSDVNHELNFAILPVEFQTPKYIIGDNTLGDGIGYYFPLYKKPFSDLGTSTTPVNFEDGFGIIHNYYIPNDDKNMAEDYDNFLSKTQQGQYPDLTEVNLDFVGDLTSCVIVRGIPIASGKKYGYYHPLFKVKDSDYSYETYTFMSETGEKTSYYKLLTESVIQQLSFSFTDGGETINTDNLDYNTSVEITPPKLLYGLNDTFNLRYYYPIISGVGENTKTVEVYDYDLMDIKTLYLEQINGVTMDAVTSQPDLNLENSKI